LLTVGAEESTYESATGVNVKVLVGWVEVAVGVKVGVGVEVGVLVGVGVLPSVAVGVEVAVGVDVGGVVFVGVGVPEKFTLALVMLVAC
jgi:hypothetical protein